MKYSTLFVIKLFCLVVYQKQIMLWWRRYLYLNIFSKFIHYLFEWLFHIYLNSVLSIIWMFIPRKQWLSSIDTTKHPKRFFRSSNNPSINFELMCDACLVVIYVPCNCTMFTFDHVIYHTKIIFIDILSLFLKCFGVYIVPHKRWFNIFVNSL